MGFDHDEPDLSSDVLQASLDVRSPAVREGLRRIAGEMAQPGLSTDISSGSSRSRPGGR